MQSLYSSLNHVAGSIEVGLADFEMDNLLALTLQRTGFVQHFECGFRTEARHALGKTKLILRSVFHSGKGAHYNASVARLAVLLLCEARELRVRKRGHR